MLPDLLLPQLPLWLRLLLFIGYPILILVVTTLFNKILNQKKNFLQIVSQKITVHLWMIFIVVFLLIYLVLLVFAIRSENGSPDTLGTKAEDSKDNNEKEQSEWKRLVNNISEWDMSEMKKDKAGYYCPRGNPGEFVYRNIWLRNLIPVGFKKIEIRFTATKVDNSPPEQLKSVLSLGQVFGKNYKVSNLFIPVDGTEGLNFERYDLNKEQLDFQPYPGELQLPIEYETPVKITMTTETVNNTVYFNYQIDYIPRGESASIPKNLKYEVTFPDPSPRELRVNFGVGIYIGGCLADVEYSID